MELPPHSEDYLGECDASKTNPGLHKRTHHVRSSGFALNNLRVTPEQLPTLQALVAQIDGAISR